MKLNCCFNITIKNTTFSVHSISVTWSGIFYLRFTQPRKLSCNLVVFLYLIKVRTFPYGIINKVEGNSSATFGVQPDIICFRKPGLYLQIYQKTTKNSLTRNEGSPNRINLQPHLVHEKQLEEKVWIKWNGSRGYPLSCREMKGKCV